MENEKKVFRSRISVFLLVLIFALCSLISIPALIQYSYAGLRGLGVCFLFIVLLFTGMRYVISGNKLYLKMWFISDRGVNITDIASVKRSYNPISSHAASLRRLEIRLVKGVNRFPCFISPIREKEFIEELKANNQRIKVCVPEKKGKWWHFWDWDL